MRARQRQLEQILFMLVLILEIALGLAVLHFEQRRLRDINVAALDELGHLPIEKRQQQRADVRTVDVRVGHDNNAVVAQFVGRVFVFADARSQHADQGGDLGRREQLVEARFFHV